MRILITGASGLLGSNLALDLSAEYEVYGLGNERTIHTDRFHVLQGDLTDEQTLERVLKQSRPDVIIHCAGLTKIDDCERNPAKAKRLNQELPGTLARWTEKTDCKLLHISTATVFNGNDEYYQEDDQPDPLSVYATTKLGGERAVLNHDPGALIARVSIFGWSPSGRRSLAEYFFNHLKGGQPVVGFTDVTFCPLLVNHLSSIFMDLVAGDYRGVYHVVGSSCVSKYEFGCLIAEKFGLDKGLIHPGSVEDVDLLGPRSKNLTLDNAKISRELGRSMPRLSTSIDEFYTRYQQGYPQILRQMVH